MSSRYNNENEGRKIAELIAWGVGIPLLGILLNPFVPPEIHGLFVFTVAGLWVTPIIG